MTQDVSERHDMATYKIVRRFFRDVQPKIIARGLSLEEAQAHCKNPETSSSTATSPKAIKLTVSKGPWFDGYEEE